MGDFDHQGAAQAEIKARHFQALAMIVSNWFPGRMVLIVR